MRRLPRLALVGASLFVGCVHESSPPATPPPPAGRGSPAPHAWAPPAARTTLRVAFTDLSAEKTRAVPLSLTSSTGAGLSLVSVTGRAILDDPLAFTELHLVFENPENRVIEGNFSIVLPQGAAISRFAMKNEQGYQEGEVVERKRAHAAYEDFLHRRQDPALLEQNAGNEFTARVFPIPARGRKELIVSYQQEVTPASPYVLPLRGLPRVGSIDIEAHLAGHAAPLQRLVQQDVVPAADFRVEAPAPAGRTALRNGDLVVARVAPVVGSRPEPVGSALILVDTSASRALGMAEEARVVGDLCAAIARARGDKGRVIVAAYDQVVEPIYEGPAAGFGADALGRMRQRLALGASDLGAALAWAGPQAKAQGLTRVVLVTDGVPTAGETTGEKLRALTASLKEAGVERLDAIAVGGIRDDDLLRSLANAGLPHGGVVVDGGATPEETWRRLSEATRSGLEVKVEGAQFLYPHRVDGVQAGDEVVVYARVPEGQAVRIAVGEGAWVAPETVRAERPLLERAWVSARIKSLLEQERTSGVSEALSREILGLSTRFRVLSPQTALLVLESDRDYERFGIDRRALADILVADGGRVGLLSRGGLPVAAKVASGPTDAANLPREKTPSLRDPGPPKPGDLAKRDEVDGDGREAEKPMASGGSRAPSADSAPGAFAAPEPSPMAATPPPPPPPMAPMAAAAEVSVASVPSRSPMARLRSIFSPSPSAPPLAQAAQAAQVEPPRQSPYTGPFATVMEQLADRQIDRAVEAAFAWRKSAPGDVMALVALGEGFEAAGDFVQAARCYGSIIDLFPSRADLRRFAGERLERLPAAAGLELAVDTFSKAEEERPDHPASHRLYAYALVRQGQYEKAFAAIVRGLHQHYPEGRFAGVPRILAEDVGLVGAAWARAEPRRADEIHRKVLAEGGSVEDAPSIRFVLNWETDANDVDFHIHDADGGHAFYSQKTLPSGGELYADVTTGYGPECFTIRNPPELRRGPYTLQAHYYSRGPMGYGMGKLEILSHDGKGGLTFEERPFVVMTDQAFVDLGSVK